MAGRNSPAYRISLGGQVITDRIGGHLSRLKLIDNRGLQADQLDLTLVDDDGRIELPRHGAELALALGWHDSGLVDRGSYIVDEVEHAGAPDLIRIRARSANMRQQFPVKRSQSWHDTTLGSVIEAIAARQSLVPKIGATLASIRIAHTDQTNESDLNFITRLAGRFDAVGAIKSGRLIFVPAGQAATASGRSIPPVTITRADGDQHRYADADRDTYTGVIAFWNDVSGATRKQVIAGSEANAKRLRPTYATADDALHAATSEWQRIQRGIAEFSITLATGDPRLYPETPISVRGFKPQIDARPWLLTEVTHDLDDSAYTTKLEMEMRNTRE